MLSTEIKINIENSRTSGDGMECEPSAIAGDSIKSNLICLSDIGTNQPSGNSIFQLDFRRYSIATEVGNLNVSSYGSVDRKKCITTGLHSFQNIKNRSLPPVRPKGKLVALKPRLMMTTNELSKIKITSSLKFIPYEPYPGAVTPIVNIDKNCFYTKRLRKIKNKNNMDINVLVTHMSTLKTHEFEDCTVQNKKESKKVKNFSCTENLEEFQDIRNELAEIKKERNNLHTELHFQIQVNTELKNLLVASIGEDLLARVNILTEDKLQLTRKLLDTANNLSTHTEQVEFLAGQCEVWRSKFLASSVMIEELARWKADLSQKNQMLTESTKRLLTTMHEIRALQFEVLKHLKFLAKIRYLHLPNSDARSLSAENLNILQQMVLRSGFGIPEEDLVLSTTSATSTQCDAEICARQALERTTQPLIATDTALKALFDHINKPNE